jgi:hypothetical protein
MTPCAISNTRPAAMRHALDRFLARPDAPRIEARRLATILHAEATNARSTLPGFENAAQLRSIYVKTLGRALDTDYDADRKLIDTLSRALDDELVTAIREIESA